MKSLHRTPPEQRKPGRVRRHPYGAPRLLRPMGGYQAIGNWLQERDSNPRPVGYEPTELPLLYPATKKLERPRAAGTLQHRPQRNQQANQFYFPGTAKDDFEATALLAHTH